MGWAEHVDKHRMLYSINKLIDRAQAFRREVESGESTDDIEAYADGIWKVTDEISELINSAAIEAGA